MNMPSIPKFTRTMPSYITMVLFLGTISGGIWGIAGAWGHNQDRIATLEKVVATQHNAIVENRNNTALALTEQKKTLSDHGVSLAVTSAKLDNIKETLDRIDRKLGN